MPPVSQLSKDQFDVFRDRLGANGFTFEDRPNQVFLARKSGATVNLYNSGKVVVGGSNQSVIEAVFSILKDLGSVETTKLTKQLEPLNLKAARIGTDEVGKGDYFGPLVIAGVLVTPDQEDLLRAVGVRDSKTLSDTTITNLAIEIRKTVGPKKYEEVSISPLKYNLLYQKLRNVNRILGWGHARVIENLLANGNECELAVADQFGDRTYIESALMRRGQKITLLQMHKAERDIAVAAASILARDVFLSRLRRLSESYLLDFPKGATHVVEFGKKLIESHGIGVLQNVAKLHFSTTKEVTGGVIPTVIAEVQATTEVEVLAKEPAQREFDDSRLQLFNLISSFERDLRAFIREKLKETFGPDWWERCVDEQIRGKCDRRRGIELKKGRKVDSVDCLDFEHYWFILTAKKNWDEVFVKFFKDKKRLEARLTILKDIRNPISHSRGEFGPKEIAEAVAAVNYLRQLMREQ
jgi:ribonuclease HIII